ncbi:MAG: calcium-binding protein [Myxococcaceae bacterium]|nr:calcium-binding protein [Myxococcaceae bacterium]MCI0669760.1 calcium-binding protein [Myxococcaceae bacterium]
MSHSRLHRRLLSAALAGTLALGATACNGNLAEEELALGEATAALTTSEEAGEIGADAVANADATQIAALVDEQAALAGEVSDSASGVCDFRAKREQVLAEYDANKDGRLDREELQAIKADLTDASARARFFRLGWRVRVQGFMRVRWAFDENGDRTLSTEERTAMVDALEARCERLHAAVLEKFDADGNGTLDEAERQAARQAFRAKLAARREEILANYDANQDGVLDLEERAKLREDRMLEWQERRAALIAKYDTNGDGVLSAEEALPLRKEIQDRIINGLDAE